MNNFVIGLKRFFTNKNVITILCVIVILVVLYFGYSSSIKSKTQPVSIPVASKKINPQTKITSEDIIYKQVASSMVDTSVIRMSNAIIGKYTNINVTIPQGSPFYSDWLVSGAELPGNWIEQLDYEKGELGYYMSVSTESTLGNSVLPNTYIDIYMKAPDENGTIMFGKLMKNVKVLVVHDNNGNNIFKDSGEIGTPSKIGFAVNQDLYMLLKKAEYLNVDLVLAPRGSTVPTKDSIIVTSETLRDYIEHRTEPVPEEEIIDEIEDPNGEAEAEDNKNTTGINNNTSKTEG